MYFWNTKALRQELKAGTLTEEQKMYYFLATILMLSLVMYIPMDPMSAPVLTAELLSIVGITVLGVMACFRVNQKGDGKDFIERIVCLGWPISIKQFLLTFLAFLLLSAIVSQVVSEEAAAIFLQQQPGISVAVPILLEVWFFWRIAVHMRWISSRG